eukprot:GEZU01039734.1.p2 GENE.GEZU01039734.1~~GEZU01039734.1.p2  ORF type:complete len:237 (+),score=62.30 GEZU01039734.1:55-711(+)
MPKSKREKVVPLTKTQKRTREEKEKLVDAIRECFDRYKSVYVFDIKNSRSNHVKKIREELKETTRFFMTRNKIMKIALGKGPEDEPKENTHKLAKQLTGMRGLIFTNEPYEKLQKYLQDARFKDFPKSGFVATEDFVVKAGLLPQFSHSMEVQLRQLGLPVELKEGTINVIYDHYVCRAGQTLTPEQARVLKHFGVQMSEFQITLQSRWENGVFETLA